MYSKHNRGPKAPIDGVGTCHGGFQRRFADTRRFQRRSTVWKTSIASVYDVTMDHRPRPASCCLLGALVQTTPRATYASASSSYSWRLPTSTNADVGLPTQMLVYQRRCWSTRLLPDSTTDVGLPDSTTGKRQFWLSPILVFDVILPLMRQLSLKLRGHFSCVEIAPTVCRPTQGIWADLLLRPMRLFPVTPRYTVMS